MKRVYDLAKELDVNSKELVTALRNLGIEVKSHMSGITSDQVACYKKSIENNKDSSPATPAVSDCQEICLPANPTVRILAELMNQKSNIVIKKLMEKGMFSLTQVLDESLAHWLVESFGYTIVQPKKVDPVKTEQAVSTKTNKKKNRQKDQNIDMDAEQRPPVVTIMGHVDHGKTSLLDAIRNTKVTDGEAGGITQHIGAYKITTASGDITFLDTPGHEAFTAMRARGAKATDIVVLVVAADDGVKQQTVEAINHAKDAGVPIIVAVNKIDKPEANPDRVRQELANYDLIPEDWGGNTIFVEVSAIEKTGLKTLMEMLVLEAEMLELKAVLNKEADGTIIESKLDLGRGPVATVLVQSGSLKIGDAFVCGSHSGRVRALFDASHKKIKVALPSTPVEVLGFSGVPESGDSFHVVESERKAIAIAEKRKHAEQENILAQQANDGVFSLQDLTDRLDDNQIKELKVIIKGDVNGSVEAVAESLLKLSSDEVRVNIIHKAVGAIIEADVMLASASHAIIIGFNVRPQAKAKKLAEAKTVKLKLDTIIYNVINDIEKALKGMATPIFKETIEGQAEIRQVFSMPRIGIVAGSFVLEGKITRNIKVRLLRDNIVVYTGTVNSVRRFKDDVKEVASGYECGVKLENFSDYKVGDIFEAYSLEQQYNI